MNQYINHYYMTDYETYSYSVCSKLGDRKLPLPIFGTSEYKSSLGCNIDAQLHANVITMYNQLTDTRMRFRRAIVLGNFNVNHTLTSLILNYW